METIAVVMVVFFFFFFNCSEGVIFLPGTAIHPTPELLTPDVSCLKLETLGVVCSSTPWAMSRCDASCAGTVSCFTDLQRFKPGSLLRISVR